MKKKMNELECTQFILGILTKTMALIK